MHKNEFISLINRIALPEALCSEFTGLMEVYEMMQFPHQRNI